MNFWKVFRWITTGLFVVIVLLAVINVGSGTPSGGSNEPAPVPVFR